MKGALINYCDADYNAHAYPVGLAEDLSAAAKWIRERLKKSRAGYPQGYYILIWNPQKNDFSTAISFGGLCEHCLQVDAVRWDKCVACGTPKGSNNEVDI